MIFTVGCVDIKMLYQAYGGLKISLYFKLRAVVTNKKWYAPPGFKTTWFYLKTGKVIDPCWQKWWKCYYHLLSHYTHLILK